MRVVTENNSAVSIETTCEGALGLLQVQFADVLYACNAGSD